MTEISEEQFKRISSNAYMLSGLQQTDKDDFMIHTIIDEIKAYCNRDDVPVEMERIISKIAAQVLKSEDYTSDRKLTSYKEGDSAWTWDYSASENAFNEANLLERFRKIRGFGYVSTNSLEG